MGIENICCNSNIKISELDLINDLDGFINYLINQIKKLDKEIKEYKKNKPYLEIESETSTDITKKNEETNNRKLNKFNKNEYINLDNFNFYLSLYKVLLEIKIILDEYINFLNNEEEEEKEKLNKEKLKIKFQIKKHKSIYKYNYELLKFDVENSKIFLKNLLNTEENYDILTIQRLSKEIIKYLFKKK